MSRNATRSVLHACGYIDGTWWPRDRSRSRGYAFPHRMRVHVDLCAFLLLCMCVFLCVCMPSRIREATCATHSVRACVRGRKCIYMYDGPMRSARIVRAPAPWIIQWDDLPILGKQSGPMVTAKGGTTTT